MAEIFRDTELTLELGLPEAQDVTVSVKRDGVEVLASTGDTVDLPFSITGYDGPFSVEWDFTINSVAGQKRFESHEIVTPFWTSDDLRTEIDFPAELTITEEKLIRAERKVRKVIERYTGQKFGRHHATLSVVGVSTNELRLPERIIAFESIVGHNVLGPEFYAVRGNGWYLGANVDTPDGDFVFTSVIRDPRFLFMRGFKDDSVYQITGYWGYEDVPVAVKEAALILIEQYLCPDSEYRDRYINDATYADSDFEYNPQAFDGTGNIIADQILEEFVRRRMFAVV